MVTKSYVVPETEELNFDVVSTTLDYINVSVKQPQYDATSDCLRITNNTPELSFNVRDHDTFFLLNSVFIDWLNKYSFSDIFQFSVNYLINNIIYLTNFHI